MTSTQPQLPPRRTRTILVTVVLTALVLAVTANTLWLVAAAVVPVAALVLQETTSERSATSTVATLAAATGLILLGLGVAHS